jgi:hypothetical protein
MTFPKKKHDWSKPPLGGTERRKWKGFGSEPSLFWGFTNFLILTAGVAYSSSITLRAAWILFVVALFYLVVGIVIIPLVALVHTRRYCKMLASILRGVNLYILFSYAAGAALYALTLFEESLSGVFIFAFWLFGIGYFLAITSSAAAEMEQNPKSVVAKINPNLENLGDFKPSEDERV